MIPPAAVIVPVLDAHGTRWASRWLYDPQDNPLVIRLAVTSLPALAFTVSRQLIMEAFANSPAMMGAGLVGISVRDQRTMQVVLMLGDDQSEMVVFFAPTHRVVAFAQSTLRTVPACPHGGCRAPGCFECAWLARHTPVCGCGVIGCVSFRPVEFPPQEVL